MQAVGIEWRNAVLVFMPHTEYSAILIVLIDANFSTFSPYTRTHTSLDSFTRHVKPFSLKKLTHFRYIIFKQILVNEVLSISRGIFLMYMPLDLTDDDSTLVQVMT